MLLQTLLICASVVFVFMTCFFGIAIARKDNSVADIAWGLGFIVITFSSQFVNGINSPRQMLLTLLVLLWGMRLSVHIFLRNRGRGEDFRYKEWRKQWGRAWVLKSYLYVFLLQGFFMLLVSLPIIATNSTFGPGLGLLDRTGALIWIIGFYFEARGDWELLQFKSHVKNKGKILQTGLWKYTRHPNYFGESAMWWGIYVIALSNSVAWWTFIGPLFITFSLLRVSGVSLLERKYKGNKEYIEYQKKTSAFIPWLPKAN